MPVLKPGDRNPYTGEVIPDPQKPPEGLTPEQRLRLHYQDAETRRAQREAAQAELDAIGRSGLVRVVARVGDSAEDSVSFINPDHIQAVKPMPGKEDEASVITMADGTIYRVHETMAAFTTRLSPAPEPHRDPTERLAEYHRSKAAAR